MLTAKVEKLESIQQVEVRGEFEGFRVGHSWVCTRVLLDWGDPKSHRKQGRLPWPILGLGERAW